MGISEVKIFILSPDSAFSQRLQKLLTDYTDTKYYFYIENEFHTELPDCDIVLIDEAMIEASPASRLAQYTFEFSPLPIIYLCSELETPSDYSAVKSLTSDYLFKDQLTGAGLHNCIKYVLESSRLKLEVEKQQQRYKSLFFNAVDPAFFLSPDWEIENVNQAFTDLFGGTLYELRGKDFCELFKIPKEFEKLKNGFLEGSENLFDLQTQFKPIKRKGSFPGHLKISVIREIVIENGENNKQIAGYHGTLSNISDQRRLRKLREASDRLAMTYRLARTLAHEIRNPLTNITLSLNQLEDEVEQTDDAKMYFGIIERCAKRIDKLIEQLLHSSQKQSLSGSDCDLVDIAKSAIADARDRAHLMDIEIITDFESEELPHFCDFEKIKLAFSNLITNAIESFDGEAGKVTVGTYTDDEHLYVYVEDTGVGMDVTQQESLFDPFYTNKKEGLGMGLTATQGIILEHEGQIEIESEPGMGSTFTVMLPKSEVKATDNVNN